MEDLIVVKSLKKVFDVRTALDDVSFTVRRGETFGFLGPSGAGKTTTIKILTGQLKPTSGEVRVFGLAGAGLGGSGYRRKIGVMTDNSGLYHRLTVYDNLKLYCRLYDVPLRRIDETLETVNMREYRRQTVATLSKGMLQRVKLARALLHEPELLFLDEPTSALDPVNTQHIHEGLRQLNARGTTIFLTTHDMYEAESLCHRIAFLNNGKIALLDEPKKLRRRFFDQTITVELTDGGSVVIRNNAEGGRKLYDLMSAGRVAAVHSNEPTLGDIFVNVTGRKLG